MTVCLHCGELASEGALFCAKCGYTLPQVDTTTSGATTAAAPVASSPVPAGGAAPPPPPPPAGAAPVGAPWIYAPSGYAVLAPPVPGAVGPMPPPPAGKYCIRCRAVISRVAVYCPVCQQPQS
ncbi:MAG TPA: hypothetical protein VEH28_03155 [Thermoplasmata archaeon]|nr:hypothetical protein [Thermoplasmata archaeon]